MGQIDFLVKAKDSKMGGNVAFHFKTILEELSQFGKKKTKAESWAKATKI